MEEENVWILFTKLIKGSVSSTYTVILHGG